MFVFVALALVCELATGATARFMPDESQLQQCNPFLRNNCFGMRCPTVYDPVCASNGVTYSNECRLSMTNCFRRRLGREPYTITFRGKCSDRENNCDRACIEIYDPVCGSDNKTYSNGCYLSLADCKRPKGSSPITQAYKGECRKTCAIGCFKIYDPVCGSDGKTYSNECVMSVAECERGNVGSPITVAYKGECSKSPPEECPTMCIQVYDPLCGSDGKTYSNSCFMGIENCQRIRRGLPAITQVYKGACGSGNTF